MKSIDVVNYIVLILFAHFVADFILQSRKMGERKSKSLKWLFFHVVTYSTSLLVLLVYSLSQFGFFAFLCFILTNFLLHFTTDFITSKMTTYFYLKAEAAKILNIIDEEKLKKTHFWMKFFWTTIGFDQAIHGITLVYTFKMFFL